MQILPNYVQNSRADGLLTGLLKCLLIATLHVITGKLGLLLAIPPGYATAVWLPTGLGLAAVLLWGYRLSAGVWLGSTLLNIWVSLDRGASINVDTLELAAGIGVGAALNALAGAYGIKRLLGYPNGLDTERSVFGFTVIGGIGACLISATIGVGMLWLKGVITPVYIFESWWTWWVGDTIGVLVLTPVLLVFFGQPREFWAGRKWTVAAPMAVAFTLAVAFFFGARAQEEIQVSVETLRAVREFRS